MKKAFVCQGIVVSVFGFLLASAEVFAENINVARSGSCSDARSNALALSASHSQSSAAVNLTEKAGTDFDCSEVGSRDKIGVSSHDTTVRTNVAENKEMLGSQDVTGSEVGYHDTNVAVGSGNRCTTTTDIGSVTTDVGSVRTDIDSGNTIDIGTEEIENVTYDSGNASADLAAPAPQPQSAPQSYAPPSSTASGPQDAGNSGPSGNQGMPQGGGGGGGGSPAGFGLDRIKGFANIF